MGNIKSFCCRDSVSELDDREERARILSDNNGSSNSLYNNSSNPSQDDLSYGSINNGDSGGGGRSGGSKTMEQSALDKIYQKLAANVIDVAPGESMVIQTAEFIERQKAYQARLNQIKTAPPLRASASKVPRNLNSLILDSSATSGATTSTNTTRINTSISTAGANLTAFNQLNTSAATTSGGQGNLSSATNGLTNNTSGTSGNSPQHGGPKDKPRVEYEPISMEDIQLINEISDRTVKALKNLRVVSDEPVVTCFKP